MFGVDDLLKIGKALGWFLKLGKAETKEMRDAILDLLRHSSQSLRTLVELQSTLGGLTRETFSEKSFFDVLLHCKLAFTSNEAPELARTHCSDIRRDLKRIDFLAAKTLRTELRSWNAVDEHFADLANADETFLNDFARSLTSVDSALDEVHALLKMKKMDDAWSRYVTLRKEVERDTEDLRDVIGQMRRADEHIRTVLT